jgi:hypothetical protein
MPILHTSSLSHPLTSAITGCSVINDSASATSSRAAPAEEEFEIIGLALPAAEIAINQTVSARGRK